MFETLDDAIRWVESQQRFKPKSDLERMKEAFHLSNINLEKMVKIHVAGTNGKGSVATFLTMILKSHGYSVGTYTSPYLVRFNERIRIGFNPIEDRKLFDALTWVYDLNEALYGYYGERLSFFELVTLMAFYHFQNEKVTHIVIEVGLGGLLDATNILDYNLSLITNIGFDHMKQLGNSKESIAYNKLGILKPGHHLMTTVDTDMHPFFTSELERIGVTATFLTDQDIQKVSDDPLTFKHMENTYTLSMLGDHQMKNALLAIRAIQYLDPTISISTIKQGLIDAQWPGRLERIQGPCQTYLDGAHNAHAIDALQVTASTLFYGHRIFVLFSSLSDKDVDAMLKTIASFAYKTILTSFPDHRIHDLSPYSTAEVPFVKDPIDALSMLCQKTQSDDIVLITGSLHFVGFMKRMLTESK
jgi:dihydrofolate synthase / folylpolyglutamate synthase